MTVPPRRLLAHEIVRFAGEPVAAVVATSRLLAQNAAEAIEIDYEVLPSVVDPLEAIKPGAPAVWPEASDNVVAAMSYGDAAEVEEAFAKAAHKISSTTRRVAVGDALLAAVGVIDEPGVVEAEQVQDRRLEVVGRDDVHGGLVADLVGRAVGHAALDAAAGQPDREALAVVVAARRCRPVRPRRPAAGRSRRPSGRASCRAGRAASGPSPAPRPAGRCAGRSPAGVVRMLLWLSHGWPPRKSCTNRTPRSTSRRAIRQRVPYSRVAAWSRPYSSLDVLRLARDVERLLGGGLHRGGQLVAGDARFQVGLAGVRRQVPPVQLGRAGRGSAAATSPRRCGGGSRLRMRGSCGRSTVPWYSGGMKPLDQLCVPSTGWPPGSESTMYAGRFCASLPRP